MPHGPAKRRDIARSVLPSTNRKAARERLAALKRHNRRAVRENLDTIARPRQRRAVVDVYEGAPVDLHEYPDVEINQAVDYRRGGDKLGPLLRWARATTRELPLEERLEAVRRVFDDNLIGRHALSHLKWDSHFRIVHEHERHWWFSSDHRRRSTDDLAAKLRVIVDEALEYGDHAALNRWMKAHPTSNGAVRLLNGIHDRDEFVTDCIRTHAWRSAVEDFVSKQRDAGGFTLHGSVNGESPRRATFSRRTPAAPLPSIG